MPDYRVRGARCRLVGRDRSEAYCRFELGRAGPAPAWRKVRMRFRYRFGLGADEMGHPVEFAMWHAGGVCADEKSAPPPDGIAVGPRGAALASIRRSLPVG